MCNCSAKIAGVVKSVTTSALWIPGKKIPAQIAVQNRGPSKLEDKSDIPTNQIWEDRQIGMMLQVILPIYVCINDGMYSIPCTVIGFFQGHTILPTPIPYLLAQWMQVSRYPPPSSSFFPSLPPSSSNV
ncbi:unnamed protein product, partial [Choristocarpus tenellus]